MLTAPQAVLLYSVPALRARYFAYGSRSSPGPGAPAGRETALQNPSSAPDSAADAPRDRQGSRRRRDPLAARVPHAWFAHFYALAVALALLWTLDLLTPRRRLVRAFVAGAPAPAPAPAPAEAAAVPGPARAVLASALLLLHGARRLYECAFVVRPSGATMPAAIYATGLAYYAVVSVAAWIDAAPALLAPAPVPLSQELRSTLATPHTAAALAIFLAGSGLQHSCHAHLASLRKYTPPAAGHAAFRYVVCPHYAAELAIYVGLAMAGAPEGAWMGRTLATVPQFVLVALGAVSDGTRAWERARWGAGAVQGRWRMLPGLW